MQVKNKYFIRFANCDIYITEPIQISAKQYYDELKKFDEIVEDTEDDENCGQAFIYEYEDVDLGKCIKHEVRLSYGISDTYLVRLTCKQGYVFAHRRG